MATFPAAVYFPDSVSGGGGNIAWPHRCRADGEEQRAAAFASDVLQIAPMAPVGVRYFDSAQRRDFNGAAGALFFSLKRAAAARNGRCPRSYWVGGSRGALRCYTPRGILPGDFPAGLTGFSPVFGPRPDGPRRVVPRLERKSRVTIL